jgi:hypothetical protein
LIKDKLINAIIKEFNLDKNINSGILDIIIQTNDNIKKSKPKLHAKTYFFLSNVSNALVDTIYKETLKVLRRKKDVMEQEKLYLIVQENLKSIL